MINQKDNDINNIDSIDSIDTDDIDDKSFIHLFETNQEFKQMIKNCYLRIQKLVK